MCLRLFQKLGVEVMRYDINIAHRVPFRNGRAGPSPIICKFIRRVVKEEIIKVRNIRKLPAADIGLQGPGRGYDLRTLNSWCTEILAEAKKYQQQNGFLRNNFKVYL